MGIQRNDRRDVDRHELKLIRVGHAIWALYLRERAKSGEWSSESKALLEACQTVWGLKKAYRMELALKRKAAFAKWNPRGRDAKS